MSDPGRTDRPLARYAAAGCLARYVAAGRLARHTAIRPLRRIGAIMALLCMLLAVSACDNAVDPFEPVGTSLYAIYGFLDADADTQFVRVSPVVDRPSDPWPPTLDAEVYSVNATTGERVDWSPSTVQLEDGTASYRYFAVFDPAEGGLHRLFVVSSENDTTSASTRVPSGEQLVAEQPSPGVGGRMIQTVHWPEDASPENVFLHYALFAIDPGVHDTLSLQYRNPSPEPDGGWSILVELQNDFDRAETFIARQYGQTDIVLTGIRATAFVPSAEWARESGSNIENGHGFFGSVAHVQTSWTIDDTTAVQLGYVTR